jgi:hypothetical protein
MTFPRFRTKARFARGVFIAALGLLALAISAQPSFAERHRYYCHVILRSGEESRRCEMSANQVVQGGFTEVETDQLGRVMRETWYWGACMAQNP